MRTDLSRHLWPVLLVSLLASCGGVGTSPPQPMPPPTFGQLHIPDPGGANTWASYSTSGALEVLPTRGRGVRVVFLANAGSTFAVSLRALDGSITPLALNSGTPAPPDAGYFQIVDVNVSSSPAIYTMYARAPATLTDPANYDVLVVNRSLRADRTDSAPMTLALRARKIFTVSVMVNGSGHVTSNPGGIQCGTSFSGAALSPCTFTFGAGTVSLLPNANDTSTTRFLGWSGNCAPGVQVCTLTLDGSGPLVAVATFVARTSTDVLPATCQAAPPIAGFQWIGRPDCATGLIDEHPGIALQCDDVGFYCCEPGPANSNAPRCGGIGKVESPPDCRRFAPRGVLRQPGGCYEFSQ